MKNYKLRIERTIPAPVEEVFRAWTDAKQLAKWHAPQGMTMAECKTDPREGGTYSITMQDPTGQKYTINGTYKEFIPNKKLVFSWEWENHAKDEGETLVTVEFISQSPSVTKLVLSHELFTSENAKDLHEAGWNDTLSKLDKSLSS